MDAKAFSTPNGEFIENRDGDRSFLPNKIPPVKITYDEEIVTLVGDANLRLGNLRGLGETIPNPALLIVPYLKREAVSSSKIEGTQATMSDLFRYEVGEKLDETTKSTLRIKEVNNYVDAFNYSYDHVQKNNSLNLDLIKEAHHILMNEVRGGDMNPGEFRTSQNWLGKENSEIHDAVYVPPPPDKLISLLKNLEDFIEEPPNRMQPLIQAAILHYQFEAVHPFIDGNGRIGRLLSSLFLSKYDILPKPLLYLSAFFERNKTDYDKKLLVVSQKSKWKDWIKFFLTAIIEQADETTNHIQQILRLRTQYEEVLRTDRRNSAFRLIDRLFANPYITAKMVSQHLSCSTPAAQRALDSLVQLGILEETGERVDRSRLYVAREILSVLIK